ncbi:hypothetical protein DEO72_LG3g3376 [Vigna unguiculata]|uniref:Uncharacterized protein n=1 Tax=Vigna unguiculata TaxID=3917 RepID=A0A4D6LKF5_VIGUN|nr:hypothetical protein DEO72_LG3g3376 [Vigna unguiculata]
MVKCTFMWCTSSTWADEEPAVVGGVEVEVGVEVGVDVGVDVAGQGKGDGHMEAAVDVEHVGVEVGVGPTDKGEGDVEVEVQANEEAVVMSGIKASYWSTTVNKYCS